MGRAAEAVLGTMSYYYHTRTRNNNMIYLVRTGSRTRDRSFGFGFAAELEQGVHGQPGVAAQHAGFARVATVAEAGLHMHMHTCHACAQQCPCALTTTVVQ